MGTARYRFASLSEAIAALHQADEALVLARFTPVPADNSIIAVNDAAAAIPSTPVPGERPYARRDRDFTADVELVYLYRQLVERGHARQMLSRDGRLRELTINRVEIDGENGIFAFVSPRLREDPGSG